MKEYIVSSKVYGKKFIGQSKSLEEAIKMREEAEIRKGKI